jgi:prepilin-type processing-associated H-X9-DG protein
LYVQEFNDYLPPNNALASFPDRIRLYGPSWCTNYARLHDQSDGIVNGLLFRYNSSLAIYRCPADQSTVANSTQLRWRSYNMSASINGAQQFMPPSEIQGWGTSFRKLTEIRNPNVSGLFVFLDTHEDIIFDPTFGMPTLGNPNARSWWDIPANRHSQGANLSFADGHAEHWKWRVPKVVLKLPYTSPQSVPDPELPDYRRMAAAYRQSGN